MAETSELKDALALYRKRGYWVVKEDGELEIWKGEGSSRSLVTPNGMVPTTKREAALIVCGILTGQLRSGEEGGDGE